MSTGVRELRVWQEAVALAGDAVRAVRLNVRRETKVVSDSVLLTALAIGSHIADGYASPSATEQRSAYLGAKRALLRLETELAIAKHAELLQGGVLTELTARSSQVARLLTGYLAYLDRQIADDAERLSKATPRPAPSVEPALTRDSAHGPS
jgi:four helix bundle protein